MCIYGKIKNGEHYLPDYYIKGPIFTESAKQNFLVEEE